MEVKGIAASEGIVIGKVFKLETVTLDVPDKIINNPLQEKERLHIAIENSINELQTIRKRILDSIDEDHAMIFDAHIQIATDPEITRQVEELIDANNSNSAYAYRTISEMFAQMFENMDNNYMKERAADVRDVARRVIAHILGVTLSDPSMISEEVIVVAQDLTPSDTAQLNRNFVKGFITNIGGRTSHSAIMARSLEIPAIVGTKTITDSVQNGDIVILDGIDGVVIINPTKKVKESYIVKHKQYLEKVAVWNNFVNKRSKTVDNIHVEIAANIGSPEDMEAVIKAGGEGIGLYRTEFLYMNNDKLPTEDEQFFAYKTVLEKMQNKKVVIRTLDIGGDKHLDYLPMDDELNPFLGHRALRLCLERTDLFKTQLRALLRASDYGDLHIMFPMVATVNEFRDAKELLATCKQELISEGFKISDSYKVGIMVEIPAVAILADQFAKEVDFFSIGTNDLIQYSFAADRMNQKVSYLYQPLNPALLIMIKMVIDAAHKEGIWTGMCGEMAGNQLAAPILLGLGLDEFSMSSSSILKTRFLFSKLSKNKMKEMAEKCLTLTTSKEVETFVEKTLKGDQI